LYQIFNFHSQPDNKLDNTRETVNSSCWSKSQPADSFAFKTRLGFNENVRLRMKKRKATVVITLNLCVLLQIPLSSKILRRGIRICSALRHNIHAAQLASLGYEEPRGVKRSRDQRVAAKCNCIHGDSTDTHFP